MLRSGTCPPTATLLTCSLTALLVAGCSDDSAPTDTGVDAVPFADVGPPPPVVDIRADVNRNGTVDLTDATEDDDEESWDASHGAVFLANIDDDDKSCPRPSSGASDFQLHSCHDAADDALDGPSDIKDLAPLKTVPWPDAPDDAVGTIKLTLPQGASTDPYTVARLFKSDGASHSVLAADGELTAAELRKGVDLALEGRDIVRDDQVWDGYLDVTLEVTFTDADGKQSTLGDTVRMRVAPLLLSHHLQPIDTLYMTGTYGADSAAFRSDVYKAAADAGAVLTKEIGTDDQWTQDFFETGWMSMPLPGGAQHVITVYFRSANVDAPNDKFKPLRLAGRVVYELRGPDVAGLQQYKAGHPWDMDTLNSFGNLETIPPYDHNGNSFPMGRIIMGKTSDFYPDVSVTRLLESQKLQQPVWLDTSWLSVAHVDETVSFVKASTPRGWSLLLADPERAKQMLQDASDAGHGDVTMFEGKYWLKGWGTPVSAARTIDQVLADTQVMAQSATAAVEIKAQLAHLKQETGITDAEIIRVPFLFYPEDGYGAAYQPGTVNGTVLADDHYAAPDPHGPVIGGVDIFEQQLSDELGKHGITVHFVEDWDLYHRLGGEVHCGTNAARVAPKTKWWEAGL